MIFNTNLFIVLALKISNKNVYFFFFENHILKTHSETQESFH